MDAVLGARNYDCFHTHAIGMAVGVLVEALLPGGGGSSAGGKPPPDDEEGLKEWTKNKLQALSLLLRRLGVKAIEGIA